jgi:secondary thiamine-phosphate synthase enzyme
LTNLRIDECIVESSIDESLANPQCLNQFVNSYIRQFLNAMTHTEYLWFNTKKRQEFVRITDEVAAAVKKSGVREGMVLVSAMHITAAVYVNDWESGLIHDFQEWLEKLAPAGLDYQHHQTGEDNADAHLKRTLMGHQVILPITDGKLDLGPWEQVFYAEFDGQRKKRVVVKVMGE